MLFVSALLLLEFPLACHGQRYGDRLFRLLAFGPKKLNLLGDCFVIRVIGHHLLPLDLVFRFRPDLVRRPAWMSA